MRGFKIGLPDAYACFPLRRTLSFFLVNTAKLINCFEA